MTAAKKTNKDLPLTIFDAPTVMTEMRKVGIKQFAKVVAVQANAELMKKYSAGPNTLVICAPNGDKLMAFAGEQCSQSAICSALKQFPAFYAAWQQKKKG